MNSLKYISVLVLVIVFSNISKAAPQQNKKYNVNIPEVNQEPELVDYLSAMEKGNDQSLIGHKIDNLVTRSPINGKQSSQRTVVFLSYDKKHLYSVFMCFDDAPNLIRSTVSPRDEFSEDEDSVALHLIPFSSSQQMYGFQANAVGSQIDGVFSEGGGWDLSFNPNWFTESLIANNGYLVKIKIPLSSLRFPPGETQNWDFFVYRGIPRNNEDAYFPPYSTNIASRISQAGTLANINVERKPLKTELTPFVSTKESRAKSSLSSKEWENKNESNLGLDAKFVWDDRVVLDFTLNPDFSQIESDEPQIVTNKRFETFFPEKRPFFIENADFFSTPLNLLFTRKIAEPSAGLRTTAQLGSWSIAGMIIDDENPTSNKTIDDDAKISVTNIRKSISNDSYFGLFISDYSREKLDSTNIALQTRYRFNEYWNLDSQIAWSDNSTSTTSNEANALYLTINGAGEYWRYSAKAQSIAEEFDSPIGYIPRKGITEITQKYSYRFLADNPIFLSYSTEFELQNIWDREGIYLDQTQSVMFNTELPGQTFVNLKTTNKSERLGEDDYATLSQLTRFNQNTYFLGIKSLWLPSIGFDFNHKLGDIINYQPANDSSPELAKLQQTVLSISFKVTPKLKFKIQSLKNELDTVNNEKIFSSRQYRLKASYQFNQDWSLRFIFEQQKVNANATFSSMKDQNTTVGDLLLKWESTPGNSLFLGYGAFRDKYNNVLYAPEIRDRERSLFLKYTYRFNR
ncbi:MAG: carbohydrate binding family 9 domain-containing protein [Thalassotalea sp.]|nr:carbohydrate binding family 9 domain-containing protein [Thalassotalea sp.]